MFAFYPNRERKKFSSNPPLPDLVVIEPLVVDGVVTNHVRHIPQSNKSINDGLIYDSSTMSLRAQLNTGVQLTFVPNPSRDNDPIAINNRISSIANSITSKYAALMEMEASAIKPDVKPSKDLE